MSDQQFTGTQLPVIETLPAVAGYPPVTVVGNLAEPVMVVEPGTAAVPVSIQPRPEGE